MKKETFAWLEKAKGDMKTAEYNFAGNMLDAAAFYSQQAAEKALKAVQIEKLCRFDKIHDLVKLAESLAADTSILELCDIINPVYFVSRYPDINKRYDTKEVKEVLDASKEILKWVAKRLG
ncbi:MAG: HEPN domain-containing protein [Candidatus Aenigmatarchaeota archaeon]